jgi:hypothetical protein
MTRTLSHFRNFPFQSRFATAATAANSNGKKSSFSWRSLIQQNVGTFVSFNDNVGTFVRFAATQMFLHKKKKPNLSSFLR